MGTKKLETYVSPSCKVYDLELEAAVMVGSLIHEKTSVTHEGFTSGEGLNWDSWQSSDN